MKKSLISLLLLAMMLFTVAIPALAADVPGPATPGKTVTIKNSDSGHTYEAYQIFKGDLVTTYESYTGLTGLKAYDSSDTEILATDDLAKQKTTVKYGDGTKVTHVVVGNYDLLKLADVTTDPTTGLTKDGNSYKNGEEVVYTVSGDYLLDKDGNVVAYTTDSGASFIPASLVATQTSDDRNTAPHEWYIPGKNNGGKKATKKTLTNVDFGENLDYTHEEPVVIEGVAGTHNFIEALNHKYGNGATPLTPHTTAELQALTDDARKSLAEAVVSLLGELEHTAGPELADLISKYLKGSERGGSITDADGKPNPYAKADQKSANDEYKLTGLEEGYYFIKDKDESLPHVDNQQDKAYTDFILRVVEDEEVNAKADVPDIEKKILEVYDVNDGELMPVYGKKVKDEHGREYWEVITDPAEIDNNAKQLYHAKRTNEEPHLPLYYTRNNYDTDFVYDPGNGNIRRETTTANNYPVLTDANGATVGTETIKYEPVYRNALNGDIYALRVDENTASIGEWVRYEIVGDVPKMEGYEKYFYIMTDNLSAGLTLPSDAFDTTPAPAHPFVVELEFADGARKKLTLKDAAGGTTVVDDEQSVYYRRTDNADGTTKIELIYNDFLQYKDYEFVETIEGNNVNHGKAVRVVVTYDVQVNNKAVVGTPGNPNKVDLTYSRNPNIKPDGENDTNEPGEKDTKITGKTPEKIVRTYLIELILKKIDNETKKGLKGAEFLITGTRLIPVVEVKESYELFADTNGDEKDDNHPEITKNEVTFYKLKDGTFTDVAPILDSYDNVNNVITYGNYHLYEGYTGTTTEENGVTVPSKKYGVGDFPATYDGFKNADEAVVRAELADKEGITPKYYHYVKSTVSYEAEEIGTYKLADSAHPAEYYQKKGPNYATDNTDVIYTKDAPADAAAAADYVGYTTGMNLADLKPTHYLEKGRELVVGDDGTLDVGALGAGYYEITETKAPEGYNILRHKIYIKIEFTTDDNADTTNEIGTGKEDYFTVSWRKSLEEPWVAVNNHETLGINHEHATDGDAVKPIDTNDNFLLKIENKQGSELPETGGIGTTILYIVGAALVLFAGVILVVRKRVSKEK